MAEVSGLADTGAQMCVGGTDLPGQLGVRMEELAVPQLRIAVADNVGLRLVGVIFAVITGSGGVQSKQMVYIAQGVNELFLSKAACRELGLVGDDFPAVGSCLQVPEGKVRFSDPTPTLPPLTYPSVGNLGGPESSTVAEVQLATASAPPEVEKDSKGRSLAPCGCLKRELPPSPVHEPQFPPTLENAGKLQEWLLERYAASSFNTCPHQPLPMMQGAKPLHLFLKEGAEPVAVHRPAVIPAHWVGQV